MSSFSEAQLMEMKNESKVSLYVAWLSSLPLNCAVIMLVFLSRKPNCHDPNMITVQNCH
jgi:hypothetical protein